MNLGRNPFHYSSPARPEEFVGRKALLSEIFNRIRSRDSVALIGSPRSGKTSILEYLCAPNIWRLHLGADSERLVPVSFDCQLLGPDDHPEDFWHKILVRLESQLALLGRSSQIRVRTDDGSLLNSMESFFASHVTVNRLSIVLLLDEFDALVGNRNFYRSDFFGLLRSISSNNRGLILVTTSNQTLRQMGDSLADLIPGSPVLNTLNPRLIEPLEVSEAQALLRLRMPDWESVYSAEEQIMIARMAGGSPYLLKLIAGTLLDCAGISNEQAKRDQVGELLHERLESPSHDLWRYLDIRSRLVMILIALHQLYGEAGFPQSLWGAALIPAGCRAQLQELRSRWVVKKDSHELQSPCFLLWILFLGIIEHYFSNASTWLVRQGYQEFLLPDQRAHLCKLIDHLLALEPLSSPGSFYKWFRNNVFGEATFLPLPADEMEASVAVEVPSRHQLRQILRNTLRLDSEFDAFCQDHFSAAYRQMGNGMDRTRKENILSDCFSCEEIYEILRKYYAADWR